jgi:hypothetical protein
MIKGPICKDMKILISLLITLSFHLMADEIQFQPSEEELQMARTFRYNHTDSIYEQDNAVECGSRFFDDTKDSLKCIQQR